MLPGMRHKRPHSEQSLVPIVNYPNKRIHAENQNYQTSLVHISSRDRTLDSISASNYRIDLNSIDLRSIERIELISVEFKNSAYIVNETNNVLLVNKNTTPLTNDAVVIVPPGNYNVTELITTLIALIDAVIPGATTITHDTITNTLTFSNSGDGIVFNIPAAESNAMYTDRLIFGLLGFPRGTETQIALAASATDFTTPATIQLEKLCSWFIETVVPGIGVPNRFFTTYANNKMILGKVLFDNNCDTTNNSCSHLSTPLWFPTPIGRLKELNFVITDDRGNIIDVRGVDHSFTLKITTNYAASYQ